MDICWACADGEADASRARGLIAAALKGDRDARRILDQVCDKRALHVLLDALQRDVGGRVRMAIVSAVGFAGGDDPTSVEALIAELWNTDVEVAGEAINALADSSANADAVTDALAAAMVARPQLEVRAAIVLAWRRDQRALPILERELSNGWNASHNLNRAPGPMLGRLGAPGREALAKLLTRTLITQPDEPQMWSEADRMVRELIDGLIGRRGSPDPDGVAVAKQVIAGYGWAEQRLESALADREQRRANFLPPLDPIDPAERVVPRWAMRLRRVAVAEPGPTTRFGGQPYFPNTAVWPLHPTHRLPLTFLGQIAVPKSVAGDGTWLAHVFVYSAFDEMVSDPDFSYPVSPTAVIVHPAGRWWGPTERVKTGPTYAYERPEQWPSEDPASDRFRPGPQFGFVITHVELVPGADPVDYMRARGTDTTQDDWNKVGGTPLMLQGGEEQRLSEGWRFLASWDAWAIGHEMGDAAHCCAWVHPDGRGLLDVHSH